MAWNDVDGANIDPPALACAMAPRSAVCDITEVSLPFNIGILPRRRIRPIRQSEAAECGLASLAMIANWWGHDFDLSTIRARYPVSARGIGLADLIQVADNLGFASRPLKLDVDALNQLRMPAILHWDMNHFVVLERMSRGRAYVVDPSFAGSWHDKAALSRHFTGVAVELQPTDGFKPEGEHRRLQLAQLWTSSSGFGRSIFQTALLSLVLQAFALASPYLLQLSVDGAIPALDGNLLNVLGIGFCLFAAINAAAFLLRSFVLLASGAAVSFAISTNIARRLIRLPVSWFEKRHIGDVLARFQSVQPIQKLLTESGIAAAIDGMLAIMTVIVMAIYSPVLTSVPVLTIGFYAIFKMATLPAERRAENERIIASGKEQTTMIESVRGIVTLRLAGRETMRHAVWQNKLSTSLGASYAHERIHAYQQTAWTLSETLANILVVWLAARFVISGGFTVGMVFAFLAYRLQFATAMHSLIDKLAEFRLLSLHLERLSDIALAEEDFGFAEQVHRGSAFRGEIELCDIHYAYSLHSPPVLNGVSLHIRAGEHVAISGVSGGGKSTLIKIMLGLLEPTRGEVLVDGVPLAQFGRRNFRNLVGAVLQDDHLFGGSIAENIAGFEPVDSDRLCRALTDAAIADSIAAMPMREHTLVGDMGSTLSGGQKQRVLLARALYSQPALLLMDEGTAHLDTDHENRVNAAIKAMRITCIVVAHRHETIAAADRVMILAGGRIATAFNSEEESIFNKS